MLSLSTDETRRNKIVSFSRQIQLLHSTEHKNSGVDAMMLCAIGYIVFPNLKESLLTCYLDCHSTARDIWSNVFGLSLVHHSEWTIPEFTNQLDLLSWKFPLVRNIYCRQKKDKDKIS